MKSAQLEFRKLLSLALANQKARNPQTSLRSFARRLDENPAVISMILNGKRLVSKKYMRKMAEPLNFHPTQIQDLELCFDIDKVTNRNPTFTKGGTPLPLDHYEGVGFLLW